MYACVLGACFRYVRAVPYPAIFQDAKLTHFRCRNNGCAVYGFYRGFA